MDRKLY